MSPGCHYKNYVVKKRLAGLWVATIRSYFGEKWSVGRCLPYLICNIEQYKKLVGRFPHMTCMRQVGR